LALVLGALLALTAAAGYDLLVDAEPSIMLIGPEIVTIIIVIAVVLLAAGAASLASAIGVFAHKSWGRWLGVVSSTIGVVVGLLILVVGLLPPEDSATQVIGVVWAAAHGLAAAGLAVGGRHFQEQRGY
jgi:energy-coupling factor transporter transmembrane protein EcfT